MVRFEDAPEHPGPGTGAPDNCGLIGNTGLAFGIGGLKLAAGSLKLFPIGPQNMRKKGPKTTNFEYFYPFMETPRAPFTVF